MIRSENIGYVIIETDTMTADMANDAKVVKEEDGRVFAQGILQEADRTNRNRRIYLPEDLFPELTSARTLELLHTGNMKAENGHPLSNELVRQQTIDPDKTVAVFTKFWTEGNFVMGEFCGDEGARGDAFDKELRKGRKPSWSLRALGTVKNTSRGAEVKNLKLITYDRVIYPSHDKAYTQNLVTEAAGVPEDNKLILESNDKGIIIPINNKAVLACIQQESMNFQNIVESFDLLYDNVELINRGTQVKLTDREGGIFVANLESYVQREIMNSCLK